MTLSIIVELYFCTYLVKVKVIFDYDATQPDELTIKVGDIISDVKKQPGGWWEGVLNGRKGVFPDNFVEVSNKLISTIVCLVRK